MKHIRLQHYALLAIALVAVLAACAAYVFMYRAIQDSALSVVKAEAQIRSAAAETSATESAALTYSETAADRAILPSFLVSSADAVPFINAVEAAGKESGATVTISSLAASADGSAPSIAAYVSITGGWQGVMRGIALIENLPYALSESRLVMSVGGASSPSEKKAPQWSASMDISVLSQP